MNKEVALKAKVRRDVSKHPQGSAVLTDGTIQGCNSSESKSVNECKEKSIPAIVGADEQVGDVKKNKDSTTINDSKPSDQANVPKIVSPDKVRTSPASRQTDETGEKMMM